MTAAGRSRKNPLAEAFGLPEAPTLVARTLRKSAMTVTELRGDTPNFGRTNSIPRDDAYLVALQLRDCPDHDLYFDGKRVTPKNFVAGATSIYDLRHDPVADLRSPFRSLHFYLPRRALNDIAAETGVRRVGDLSHEPGVSVDDPVVRHLLSALLPAMARPAEASAVFLDHVAWALTAHVAHVYGGMRIDGRRVDPGLTSRQLNRVRELMSSEPAGALSLQRLAMECGLSVRHFTREFRQSTGMSPHRWMLQERVARAKSLLQNSSLSLVDVAMSCGFADQSHFSRVFTTWVGISPGAWRRRA